MATPPGVASEDPFVFEGNGEVWTINASGTDLLLYDTAAPEPSTIAVAAAALALPAVFRKQLLAAKKTGFRTSVR